MARTVNIPIVASVERFLSGFDRAHNAVERLGGKLTQLGNLAETYFGVRIARALGAWISRTVEAANRQVELGQALDLPLKRVQQLDLAARLAGSDLERLTGAAQKLRRGMVEDTAAARAGFEKLRLDAAAMLKLPIDEVLLRISGAFARLTDAHERAAVAQQLFGKSGAELIPLLLKMDDAVQTATAHLAAMGAELNELDATRIGAVDDALDKFNATVSAGRSILLSEMSPALLAIEERFNSLISFGGGLRNVLETLTSVGVAGANILNEAYLSLAIGVSTVAEAATKLASGLASYFDVGLAKDLEILAQGFADNVDRLVNTPSFSEDVERINNELKAQARETERARLTPPPPAPIERVSGTEVLGDPVLGTENAQTSLLQDIRNLMDFGIQRLETVIRQGGGLG